MNWGQLLQDLAPRRVDVEARDTKTIVSVIYYTAPKTFDGPAIYVTAGQPIIQTRSSSKATPTFSFDDDSDSDESVQPTTSSARSTARPTPSVALDTSSVKPTSALVTSAALLTPSTTLAPLTRTTAASTSRYSSAAASASATPTASSGMSGGGIAGLIFGLLLGIGALIGAIVFFNKRQKKKQLAAHRRLDDEKAMASRSNASPVAPSVGPYPTAPRISLRPGSQFSPNFGTAAGGAAAGVATTATFPADSNQNSQARSYAPQQQQQPMSGWERPGANNANDPANPFGNHAETLHNSPPRDGLMSTSNPEPVSDIKAADFPLPGSSHGAPRLPDVGIPPAGMAVGTAITDPSNMPVPAPHGSGGDVAAAAGVAGAAALAGGAAAAAAARSGSGSPDKPAESKVHRVQMDFHPSMDDEIPIRTGQLVKVQHEYDDGWALVSYMDGSRSGVCPRTCLSKNALQPRPKNGPPPHMNGRPMSPARGPGGPPPGMRGPPGQGRPMSPARGPNGPYGPGGPRSQSPYGPGPRSQSPYGPGPRSQSPYGNPGARSQSPYGNPGPRSQSPAHMGRPRAGSASSAGGYRSMSPGPYGAGGLRPTPRPDNMQRRRSNSMGQVDVRRMQQHQPQGSQSSQSGVPMRKPVGGME